MPESLISLLVERAAELNVFEDSLRAARSYLFYQTYYGTPAVGELEELEERVKVERAKVLLTSYTLERLRQRVGLPAAFDLEDPELLSIFEEAEDYLESTLIFSRRVI